MTAEPWQPAAAPPGDAGAARTCGGAGRGRSLRARRRSSAGVAVLLFWIVDAVAWRSIVPHRPAGGLRPRETLQPPSAEHWFGTDDLGRDVFSRVLAGASSVLTVAPAAALLAVAAGVAVGLVAGYVGGAVDEVLMRLVDALLAFPLVVGAVLVLAVTGVSRLHLVLVIAVVLAPLTARTVRAAVRGERGARVRGGRSPARRLGALTSWSRRSCRTSPRSSSPRRRRGSPRPSSPRRRCPSSGSASSSPRPTGASPSRSAGCSSRPRRGSSCSPRSRWRRSSWRRRRSRTSCARGSSA